MQNTGKLRSLLAVSVSAFSLFGMVSRKDMEELSQVSAINESKMVILATRHIDIFTRVVSECQ